MAAIIEEKDIIDDLSESYIDYARMVIQGRAISNIEDNQKPSSLAVLYAMHDLKVSYNGPFVKSARIVGEVIGKYHPHGDSSAYGTLVNMAQDFSMNIPYISPNGNFGSISADQEADKRYTECKLNWYTEKIILKDLAKDVVEYIPNYDDSLLMPLYFPEILPDILINGNIGIGVGFAASFLPHNLNDVINLCIEYIKNRSITT